MSQDARVSEPSRPEPSPFSPSPLKDAAAVLLVREIASGEREIFWVRRGEETRFSGGFYAFPGGKVDPADAAFPLSGLRGAGPEERAMRACAIRELFEETGILLGMKENLAGPRAGAIRRELLAGEDFARLLAREGISLDASRCLIPAGRWVTPEFSPIRFDARFYLAVVPRETAGEIIPGELSHGEWIMPKNALALWDRGEALLHPPTLHALRALAGWSPNDAIPILRNPPFLGNDFIGSRIEFLRGVILVPLRTPTILPAFHTNAILVGTGELAIIDPGSPWEIEQRKLSGILHELAIEGRMPKCILITHHHHDHAAGAAPLAREFGIPIFAGAETAARIGGADRLLADGDSIELDGPKKMKLEVLLTEGHTRGHLAFFEPVTRTLFAGDLIANGSTIVVDPPEGHLGDYLASLRRVASIGVRTIYPGHGLAITNGPKKIAEYISHREKRLEEIAAALERGWTVEKILAEHYGDTPASLLPLARRSIAASIEELDRRRRRQ